MSDINDSEYIYLTIPKDYEDVYKTLLILLSEYGEEMLKDCKAACANKNRDVIDCFNMFNSAVAARELGQEKLAQTIMKYIRAKIKIIYGVDILVGSIYYGAGLTDEAATNEVKSTSTPAGNYTFNVEIPESYIWLVIPSHMSITHASLNNFDFPLEEPYTIQKEGQPYKVYRSSNTYDAVSFTIQVI